jgi:hypothetical protein
MLTFVSCWIAAPTLSPGLLCPDRLAYLGIHGDNAPSFRTDVGSLRAEIEVKTTYYLREKFDNIDKLTDRMFGSSLGKLVGEMGLKKTFEVYQASQYLSRYFSLRKWLRLWPRIAFNTVKIFLVGNMHLGIEETDTLGICHAKPRT